MSNLFAVGTKNSEPFAVTLDAESTSNLIGHALKGEDVMLESTLELMEEIESEVINAMCWEGTGFLNDMIAIIEHHGRFAIKHKELEFGVSTDFQQAAAAFKNKEF